ncbi:type II restriction endonuclease [Negadavirga shengliensis]|uniref:Type II restriction endonuclease n=1 Tax=Negadavirga shengliensis TaxID=1389218 RepID=A0ABV9T886_9BACT
MGSPLSKYFVAAGAKRLSQVEVRKEISNQHEFNGVLGFKEIFGSGRISFPAKFLYLADEEDDQVFDQGSLTWYDARENHPTRSEFRLYYSANTVTGLAKEADLVLIAKSTEGFLLVVVCPSGSTHESQLLWLFGLEESERKFVIREYSDEKSELGYAGKMVISYLGLEIEEEEPDFLDDMIREFGLTFPSTAVFSRYARRTLPEKVSAADAPDEALMAWLEWEEALFRTLERKIVGRKLSEGFGKDGLDVDDFVKFSLSVQNRRKSRAGYAFENHLAEVFDRNAIQYTRGAKTERNNKPDFLFPGIEQYFATEFPTELLTMLGLKTTAKDRWRQVIPEADRIPVKHLVTLEPAISSNQTEEMKIQKVQLVLPKPIMLTYTKAQQAGILTLSDFIGELRDKENKRGEYPSI